MHSSMGPIEVFCAYARKDEILRSELEKHLSPLQRQGLIALWDDRHIVPGTDWTQGIHHHLNSASMILLLISPDFLASNYCYDIEMQSALERHKRGEAYVVPIILRSVDWQHSPFAHLQCLPLDGKPVTEWDSQDAAFRAIIEGLRRTIQLQGSSAHTRSYRNYLRWLIERNCYLDPRGTFQTQRQVQVKIEEVYISLMAQRDDLQRTVDLLLLEEELASLNTQTITSHTAVEGERQHEQMLTRFELNLGTNHTSERLELAEAVNHSEQVVILGDPGSGKTTLLRYLALKHAQALLKDQQDLTGDLGPARFPILIRIADYAEYGIPEGKSLSEFLADSCSKYECPKAGLADLLATELKGGNCLVLMDGLDEIVSTDDRLAVVRQIEDFVRSHSGVPNRFVITSRVVGYRNVRLSGRFIHYIIQEMNEGQIRQFLGAWCSAVETAQTPDLSAEMRKMTATREIDGIMKAILNSPGVRRLATNPLLLRTLALIHRSGAQLPQKRIELYKLAADVLARTWRTAQGIPETVLVDENYLTRLLSKLAYWLHLNTSTGLATEQDVYRELGQELARIKGWMWEEDHPDIRNEVQKFLQAVREHTGLFVERAPKRYGFMHLTFEEYYAARYLVARSRERMRLIRQHLHDPRWEEPILLALGFVGLDSPEDAADLLEGAIMAEGEEAKEAGFTSSKHEELLGRDFLFTLRCLGDNIYIHPPFRQRLVKRLVGELLYREGPAKFSRYRQALYERLEHLNRCELVRVLLPLLMAEVNSTDFDVSYRVVESLGYLGQVPPEVISAFIVTIHSTDQGVHTHAIRCLSALVKVSSEAVTALLDSLQDRDYHVRLTIMRGLEQLKQPSADVVSALIRSLNDNYAPVCRDAAHILASLSQSSADIMTTLLYSLADDTTPLRVRTYVTCALGDSAQLSPEVLNALLSSLAHKNATVRYYAAYGLGGLKSPPIHITTALLQALNDEDNYVRWQSARSLGRLRQSSSEVITALLHLLNENDGCIRYWAAYSLGQLSQSSVFIIPSLLSILSDINSPAHFEAALALGKLDQWSDQVRAVLTEGISKADDQLTRENAARLLGQEGQYGELTIQCLLNGILNNDLQSADGCAEALAELGRRFPDTQRTIEERLVQVIGDPEVIKLKTKALQMAYKGLWLLVVGGDFTEI